MSNYLDVVTVEHNPANKPIERAVIWLHGLGASGHDFEPVVPQLGLDNDMAVRFIFPHAPQIPVTINGGMVMPAWYDILEMSLDRKIDVAQIEKSSQQIRDLIQREIERGVKPEHIVIAGFSQAVPWRVLAKQRWPGQLAPKRVPLPASSSFWRLTKVSFIHAPCTRLDVRSSLSTIV